MKKWLILSSLFVLFVLGCVIGIYWNSLQPKNKLEKAAFETAKEEAGVTTMDEFYLYHGQKSFSIIIGKTSDGEQKIVWIPDQNNKKVVTNSVKNGKTKKDIQSIVEQNVDPKEIISIKPGMENSVPLWEVTYIDQAGKYNYDYYDFKTGEWLKYYRSI